MLRRLVQFALLGASAASAALLLDVHTGNDGAFAEQGDGFAITYRGELLDAERRPLSGVFGVTFELLHQRDATDPLWTEQHWVAVSEGMYDLRLGNSRPLPPHLANRQLWLRILIGGAEVGMHQIAINDGQTDDVEINPGPFFSQRPIVDLAGHALGADRAERARDCRTLDGRTLEQLDRSAEFESQLADLRRQLRAASEGPFVGEDQRVLDRIGGETGNPYQVMCPPGYVVTGIRGKGGNVLDSYNAICSQIR